MVIFEKVKEKDVIKLKELGFTPSDPKTVYEVIRYQKNNVTAILYTSEKLFLQGKKELVEKIADKLEQIGLGKRVKIQEFKSETGWMIGSDESLKGDTFGGLVVAAVKADHIIRNKLLDLGVADSKTLADKEILIMAESIKKIAPCNIKSILPLEYNQYDGNVTQLLNKMHLETAKYLAPGGHIVDQYPGCTVGDVITTKAESKYIEVAAASILARAVALKQLSHLSKEAGFHIPKGSTHVKLALHELKERKLDFNKFVKVNFNNVKEFLKENK